MHMYMVELLASRIFGNLLKNAVGEILFGIFEYCMERNQCLQPKWYTFNLAIQYLRDSPNRQIKTTTKYVYHVYNIIINIVIY